MPKRRLIVVPKVLPPAGTWNESDAPICELSWEYVEGWVEEPPTTIYGPWEFDSEVELPPEYLPRYTSGLFRRIERLVPLRRFRTTYKRTVVSTWVDKIQGPMAGPTRYEYDTRVN